jgi:hypothetical protein
MPITSLIPLATFAIGLLVGWYVDSWRHDAIALAEKNASEKALQLAAQAIARIDVKQVTIRRDLETITRENTVYRDCRITDDGMRLLRQAYGDEPVAVGKLPASVTANRPDDGGTAE